MARTPDPWQEYRRSRRLLLGSALAGLAALTVGFYVAKVQHSPKPLYVGLATLVLLAIWGSGPLAEFPCPHCGEPFTRKDRQRNLFTRKCLHCRHPRN